MQHLQKTGGGVPTITSQHHYLRWPDIANRPGRLFPRSPSPSTVECQLLASRSSTGHGTRITSHVLVTSLLPYLSPRSPRRLLHCSIHGSPTPRPTFPRRSPLARRDRARHPRFTALHRAAPARRSALLDRNWLGSRRDDPA